MKRSRIFRTAGWVAVASLLGAALIAPSAALAQDGNQSNVSSEGRASDCSGGPDGSDITPGTGQIAWLFVHANPDSDSGTLTANFQNAGQLTADSYIQGGVKYVIVTDRPDTLLSFSDDIDGGVLNLSHTCYGATETTTTSTTEETTSSSTTQETTASSTTEETTSTTEETTASSTTEETTASSTTEETTSSSTTEETTASSTTEETTSSTTEESSTTSEESTPSGSVEAETGTPQVTPPSTDTIGGTGSTPSSGGWQLALVAMAGLLATVLVLTPAAKKRRR